MEWTEFYRMYNNRPIPYKKIISADLSEIRTKNFKKESVKKFNNQDNKEGENKKTTPKLTKGFYLYKYETLDKEIVYIGQTIFFVTKNSTTYSRQITKFFWHNLLRRMWV